MRRNICLYIFLCLVLLCSINLVSAMEFNESTEVCSFKEGDSINSNLTLVDESNIPDCEDSSIAITTNEDIFSEDDNSQINESIVYVGLNKTDDGGNGSYENPFASLDLACNNVSDKEDIIIKIFNGTYDIASEFNFNAKKISIIGEGEVIFKYSINKGNPSNSAFSFILTSAESNITFKNIIFDGSTPTAGFTPLRRIIQATSTNIAEFYNCSFLAYKNKFFYSASGKNPISKFYGCNFVLDGTIFTSTKSANKPPELFNADFNYCSFVCPSLSTLVPAYIDDDGNLISTLSINNCWFGSNSLPQYVNNVKSKYFSSLKTGNIIPYSVYSYAQMLKEHFVINYLGNGQYEIIGKLNWNGTEDQDGMENFQPMTVNLVSSTGDINQTATLVNGNFRAIYASSNSTHKVTATLHDEEIELEFTTVNITTNPVSIYYGEDQNITFNFTQPITANVTVTVSNGSYNKSEKVEVIGKDSLIYTVPDTLKAGAYDVEINLAENNLFGFNTTTLTVSKVSDYTFEVATGDVKVNNNATISITLPDDVTGTVIVKFGNDTKELPANKTMTVNFTNLNATTYGVTVSYSGNDKYVALDKSASVTVNKVDSVLEIEDVAFTYGEVIAIPFNVTNANGVTVSVLNKDDDEVATASSESGNY